MAITTESTATRPAAGCSDPFPAGYYIRFGTLEFEATGNGYLMRLLRRGRAAEVPAPEPAAVGPLGPSPLPSPRRRGRRGQRSRQARAERRRAVRADALVAGMQMLALATEEHAPPPIGLTTHPAGRVTGVPYGVRNTAAIYASSVSTNMSAYEDLPGRHLRSIRDLIATSPDERYPSSEDPSGGHDAPDWDFCGLQDPGAVRRFLAAMDYCLTCSDDSSDENYDPARECFVVEIGPPEDDDGAASAAAARGDPQTSRPRATPPTDPTYPAQLAQIQELEAKLAQERQRLHELRAALDPGPPTRGERAREAGRVARTRIEAEAGGNDPLALARASQKLVVAATLIRAMPEPSTPEGRNLRREAQTLVEQAAVQQAESSASRMRRHPGEGAVASVRDQEGSVCTPPQGAAAPGRQENGEQPPAAQDRTDRRPVRDRLRDTRGRVDDGDARNVINARRDDVPPPVAHPRRGGRYDREEDRSPSPEPAGTRAFSRKIRTAPIPPRFRQPATVAKYSGESDPRVWLNDYRLACQLGGATDDAMIIRNLPLHLADSARTWLEHLPPLQIHSWDDLVRIFVGNFQGTYARPGNSWDLRGCRQKTGESLRDFIRRFSKRCTELPSVGESEVIHAFLEGTSCRDLVRELGRKPPNSLNELFDVATNFASGEEAVGAIFDNKKGKLPGDTPAEGCKPGNPAKRQKKKGLRAPRAPARDDGSEEVNAVDPARKPPRPAPRGPGVFDEMLKKPCPYHRNPVAHTLEQCDMLKKYYSNVAARSDDDKRSKEDNGDGAGFPRVENVFFIVGGPTAGMTPRQRKRERREVFAVQHAPPTFLDWSEETISFGRDDHPDRIPNPGQYPLVVDPVVGNTRLTRVLMDGGSSLNVLFLSTLELLGIGQDQLRPSTAPFHGVAPGKRVQPLGRIDLPVYFGTPANFRKEDLTFEVVGFRGAYHAILGRPSYAKFMAVPNYTYLKMKMPGPRGVITVGTSFQHAYECDVECVERAEALAQDEALAAELEGMANEGLDPAAKRAGSFEAAEHTKTVPLDPSAPEGKMLRVSSSLDSK